MTLLRSILYCSLCLTSNAIAQQAKLTDVSLQGYIYEPARLSPTFERITSLTVPAGMTLNRFAEGLDNPRMIAVADNGDVYVTQRAPA